MDASNSVRPEEGATGERERTWRRAIALLTIAPDTDQVAKNLVSVHSCFGLWCGPRDASRTPMRRSSSLAGSSVATSKRY